MADNTTLPTGTGGDVIRNKDRATVKTQIVALDMNPAGATEILDSATALADALANPTLASRASFMHGFNGTTWDRLRSTIANGLLVDISRGPTLTKGTQGTTGFSAQQLKDAGRNPIHFYMLIPIAGSATDTLQSLTGTKSGATVTATTTPAVVTAGKTLRITRFGISYIATATAGLVIARLRFNTAGVVVIGSPIAASIAAGAGTPATANSTASVEAVIPDGFEFAAGTGIGISTQTFSGATATAAGFVLASVSGFEY
jgi:hypothetical protein